MKPKLKLNPIKVAPRVSRDYALNVITPIFPLFSYSSMIFGMQDKKFSVWFFHLEVVHISNGGATDVSAFIMGVEI